MIQTTIPIIGLNRSQIESIVHIEIFDTHDDPTNERFLFIIRDYIVNGDNSQFEIARSKPIPMTYVQRDQLKQLILSQYSFPKGMSESQINNAIKPYALLYYVQTDLVSNGKCIYGLEPNQFKVSDEYAAIPLAPSPIDLVNIKVVEPVVLTQDVNKG